MQSASVVVSSRVDQRLAAKLDDLARAGERTRSRELRQALRLYLAVREQEHDDDDKEHT